VLREEVTRPLNFQRRELLLLLMISLEWTHKWLSSVKARKLNLQSQKNSKRTRFVTLRIKTTVGWWASKMVTVLSNGLRNLVCTESLPSITLTIQVDLFPFEMQGPYKFICLHTLKLIMQLWFICPNIIMLFRSTVVIYVINIYRLNNHFA